MRRSTQLADIAAFGALVVTGDAWCESVDPHLELQHECSDYGHRDPGTGTVRRGNTLCMHISRLHLRLHIP